MRRVRSGEERERERKGVVGGGAPIPGCPWIRVVARPRSVDSRWTAGGGARAFLPSFLPSPSLSVPAAASPRPVGCPSFPSGSPVPLQGWRALRPPRGVKGVSAASASPPPPSSHRWPHAAGVALGGGVTRVSSRWDPLLRLGAPAPTLSGYLAIAFRRVGLKTPGGVALSVPGVGGTAGARREPVSLRLPPLPRAAVPEAGRGLWGSGAPPRAPVGPVPRRPALPGAPTPGAGPVSLPSFPFSRPDPPSRSLCFCLVFHAGRPEANPPLRSPLGVGGGWTVPPSATCVGASPASENVRTTLSGGSLGSCVDEERS